MASSKHAGDRIPRGFEYYVTMTDSFMSGWGRSEGRTNKLVVPVDDYERASRIAAAARKRDEMKYVSIASEPPRYPEEYLVSVKYVSELGARWDDWFDD